MDQEDVGIATEGTYKTWLMIKRPPLIEAGEDHVSFLGHIVGKSNILLTVPG